MASSKTPPAAATPAPVDPFAGFEFEDARPPITPVDGWLRRPHKDRTDPVQFVGVLRKKVDYVDAVRKKEQFFLICESLSDQSSLYETEEDEEAGIKAEVKPITKGILVGVSGSGALKSVSGKLNHLVRLTYSGKKVATPNGEMWEIDVKVSTKPYDNGKPVAASGEVPFG